LDDIALLDRVVMQVQMNRADHVRVQQAVQRLRQAFAVLTAPPPPEAVASDGGNGDGKAVDPTIPAGIADSCPPG